VEFVDSKGGSACTVRETGARFGAAGCVACADSSCKIGVFRFKIVDSND